MCGRFENKSTNKDVIDLFSKSDISIEIDSSIDQVGHEDIRPTQKILTILRKDNNYILTKVNWGIKFSKDSPLIFNSRIETIKEKEFWHYLFDHNRCIVPMTGFYEWQVKGTDKIKYKIYLPDQDLFFVPAVYALDKENNICASLISTVANKFISQIHHRMPVIFDFQQGVNFLIDDVQNNLQNCLPYDNKKVMAIEIAD
jgi:putative SOS response-associated peptidase YedK